MKINEVCGAMIYIALTIENIHLCTVFLGFKNLSIHDKFVRKFFNVEGMNILPPCVIDHEPYLGKSIVWMMVEVLIFAFYTATLLILMMKSRF